MCKVLLDLIPRDQLKFIFMDTGAEHPKTYEFIRKVDQHFDLNLVVLRGDFSSPLGCANTYSVHTSQELRYDLGVFGGLCKKYGTPSVMRKWCTSRMKEEIHDKYCDTAFGRGGYTTWIGIRNDEPKRLKGVGRPNIKYLAEVSDASKQDILDFWERQPFDLEIQEYLGNCVF
jgi:3'-phosphoadenosine 5'-phosphosulfate sulfotransferase (PAPS reductase)/FAD synthetase